MDTRFDNIQAVDLSTYKPEDENLRSLQSRFGGIQEVVGGKPTLIEDRLEDSWTAVALDTIPYGKYILPEEQEKFSMLSGDEKAWAIGLGALGAALFAFGGPLLSKGGRALGGVIHTGVERVAPSMATRFAKMAAKEMPIEDALMGIGTKAENTIKPFSYENAVKHSLRGFNEEEALAISKYKATGNQAVLKDAVLERSFKNKSMSKKWSENVSPSGEPYGGFKLNNELNQDLSEEILRAKHYSTQYKNVFAREVLKTDRKEISEGLFDRTYQRQMQTKYPPVEGETAAYNLEHMNENDFATFVTDMLENKREYRQALSTTSGCWWPASLTPTRVVYGLNENNWGAYTKTYKPLKAAVENSREFTFYRTLNWMTELQQRGLGKIEFSKYGDFTFNAAGEFTAKESDKAYQILRQIDNISGQAKNGVSQETITGQISKLLSDLDPKSTTKKVIDAWRDFSDNLYGEFLTQKIPSELRKAGNLTEFGQNSIDNLMQKYTPKIWGTYSTQSSRSATQKIIETKQYLQEIKDLLKPNQGTHPWFNLTGKELDNHVKELTNKITLSNDGGKLVGYTDHYTARISETQEKNFEKWSNILVGKRGQFEAPRKSAGMIGEPVDFKTMIESRIHSQGNATYLYPVVDEVVNGAKEYPTHLASYVEHHLSRVLNMPSKIDHVVAGMLEKSIGKIEGLFGAEGIWNARRVMNTAQTINDLVYLGGLGFKPFSAARNLFQPLITVPADMGGLKDYGVLARGYARAHNPNVRSYLKEIGIISEYAPETTLRPDALPFSKTKLFGREIDTTKWNSVKDAALWMFKGSDRFNKYVTGAAAMEKWEGVIKKFPEINSDTVTPFMKQVGLTRRNPWVKNELEDLLRRGKLDEAKAGFIRDIVGDTQFLYGSIDAPTILGSGGAVGRTGLMFQSYWMNLMPLLQKWAVTGSMDEKGMRLVNFVMSQAAAYSIMEPIWGERPSLSSVGFGPFPGAVSEYMIPPAWAPIYRAGRIAVSIAQMEPKIAGEQAKQMLGSTMIYLPAGLQIKKSFKGAREEGFTGFAKSIVGYPLESQVKD